MVKGPGMFGERPEACGGSNIDDPPVEPQEMGHVGQEMGNVRSWGSSKKV